LPNQSVSNLKHLYHGLVNNKLPAMIATKSVSDEFLIHNIEHFSKSGLMQDLFYKIMHLSKLDSPAILVGEVGSGKDRLARVIHDNSQQKEGPFQTFSCLDIDENDFREAFWGQLQFDDEQLRLKYDLLEKAIDGSLYLSQFSELSNSLMLDTVSSYQTGYKHLFSYREEKKRKPLLIISFDQNLYTEISDQDTWNEILNELNPVVIMLPPLREHKEDIPLLIDYYLEDIRTNSHNEYKNISMSTSARLACLNYDWPGNYLQLKNVLMQGAILTHGKVIKPKHLPFSMSLD